VYNQVNVKTKECIVTVLNKAAIQNLIATNDKAVVRGLIAIYERQTEAEKNTQATLENNGIGFSGCDAEILSSFVKWYKEHGYLSPKQLAISRNKITRYWKQLLQVAASNGHTVVYK
jgi:hypothetical protein